MAMKYLDEAGLGRVAEKMKSAVSVKNDRIAVADDTSALTDSDSFDETPAGENPTATKRRLLSSLWTYIKGKVASVLGLTETNYGGTSAYAGAIKGFTRTESATWGTQVGAFVAGGADGAGGGFAWRKDNPTAGQVSLVVDGTVYVDEGKYPVLHTHGGQVIENSLYFEGTEDMVIGHGKPPKGFVDMSDSAYNRLVEGAYMAHGNDETGGIIVGGDGIDLWAPPDNDLVRFWNEDDDAVVLSVGGYGEIHTDGCRRGKKSFTSSGYGDNEIRIDFDKGMDDSDYILTFEFTRGAEYVDKAVLVREKESDGFDITIYTDSEDEYIEFEWCAFRVLPPNWQRS